MNREPVVEASDAPGRAVLLAGRVIEVCRQRALTLATAESCTGGLVGHLLTQIPGASSVFMGGVISYSDASKVGLLGVGRHALEHHGAVSAQVCVAMAEGARSALGSDLALAITGIAGPDGGTPAKPVGLVYVAVADAEGHEARRHIWNSDRSGNKEASAAAALELVLARLGSHPGPEPGIS